MEIGSSGVHRISKCILFDLAFTIDLWGLLVIIIIIIIISSSSNGVEPLVDLLFGLIRPVICPKLFAGSLIHAVILFEEPG
jgi:hypothetical protein